MKKILLLVIILLCLIPVFTQAENNQNEEETLIAILKTIEGRYLEGDVSANGLLFDKFLSEDELNDLGKNIIKSLGLVGEERDINTDIIGKEYYVKDKIIDDKYKQLNYYGFDENKNQLTIILSSYINEELTKGETYLYINLIKKEQFIEINDIIIRIENIFKDYDKQVEFTTCLIGDFNGKFSEKDVQEKIIKAISKLKGKIVDVYKDDEMISYTAYTDCLDNNILAGDDKINLNIALRYNQYDNKTLIWIGTPIIANGY